MARTSGIAGDRLLAIIERIERLEEEIRALNADKSEVYKEAKGIGFDVAAIKRVVAYRRKDQCDADEAEAIFQTYLNAVGDARAPDEEAGTDRATRARARAEAEA